MRLQYRLRQVFILITCVSLALTTLTTIFCLQGNGSGLWSILNNIMICISTGCVIGCIQSFVGYANEKRMSILTFYKEAMMLEDAIINYPYMRSGFTAPDVGIKDIRKITLRFMDNFKFAWMSIYLGKSPDHVLKSVELLYSLYCDQIKPFRKMENALIEALRDMDISGSELIAEGIDIPLETAKINETLQSIVREIKEAYNKQESQKGRTANYLLIEKYLFSKKREKQQ